jgi:hypothetical protein
MTWLGLKAMVRSWPTSADLRVARSRSAGWRTSDVPVMLSAQPFVTLSGSEARGQALFRLEIPALMYSITPAIPFQWSTRITAESAGLNAAQRTAQRTRQATAESGAD